MVSKEGISTDPGKTKVINDWPIPSNISDLRSFLGCVGYYRQFIRDFAKIAEPLYKLERKEQLLVGVKKVMRLFKD